MKTEPKLGMITSEMVNKIKKVGSRQEKLVKKANTRGKIEEYWEPPGFLV